jgi:hypothetical protein
MTKPRELVEVVTTFGDTTLAIEHVPAARFANGLAITDTKRSLRVGLVDYTLRRVPPPTGDLPRPAIADRRAVAYILVSLAAHLALYNFAGDPAPDPVKPLPVERPRLVRVALEAPPSAATTNAGIASADAPGLALSGGGQPSGRDGGSGKDVPRARGDIRITQRDVPNTALSRAQIIDQARSAGVLGAIAAHGTAFRGLGGSIRIGGGLGGTRIVPTEEPRGGFGGGTGWGVTCGDEAPGHCRFGTVGHGTGTGSGIGMVREYSGLGRAHVATVPSIRMCSAKMCVVEGALDKAIIRRYIQRVLPKLQYCYESALLANPALAGTVVASFVISRTGAVTTAEATGMADAVAACVAGVIRAIEFPRSKVDESTSVNYPFMFRST